MDKKREHTLTSAVSVTFANAVDEATAHDIPVVVSALTGQRVLDWISELEERITVMNKMNVFLKMELSTAVFPRME